MLAIALWSSGAPSVLYPLYAEQWGLSPVVVTSVFATYQLALVVALPLFGNLSDVFGRRCVMIGGVALIGASALVFAVAPNVGFLFAGRVLQGLGAGLAMGAATASLVENNTSASPRFASSAATVSTAVGLTAALALSGLFAEFVAMPLVWSYVVLLVLAVVNIWLLVLSPDDRPTVRRRWRPQAPKVPTGIRLGFMISTLSVALAYCVGAIFLSLGAHMIREFADTENSALIGVILACSSATIGVTGLLLSRISAHASVLAGAVVTLLSLVLMAAASAFGSLPLFFGWCIVGGVAYALAFTGGLGLINRLAPAHHRGASLSLLYVVAYALQAGTAIGVGAIATGGTLATAVLVAAAVLGAMCVAVIVLISIARRSGHISSA
ncbi:MFS transporter [Pseudoclavibacter sp. VKM Ac-2888]|nr:MFS transporter [Pseudoclavibacter sp. VKM Ac-2888]